MLRTKLIRAETKVEDAQAGRISAIVSTEDRDRDGDIIRQEGWNLDNFSSHPVLLASHDYRSLTSQIGEWEDMGVKGKKLVGQARYYIGDGNAEADWGFKLASRGVAAYSVGFIPDMAKAERMGKDGDSSSSFVFKGQELLEISHVTVPSNPKALQHLKALATHPVMKEILDEMTDEEPPLLDALIGGLHDQMEATLRDYDLSMEARMAKLLEGIDDMFAQKFAVIAAEIIKGREDVKPLPELDDETQWRSIFQWQK